MPSSMSSSPTDSASRWGGLPWLLRLLWRGRMALVVFPLLTAIGAFLWTRFHMAYAADATIRPQTQAQAAGRAASLAAQFGLTLPGAALGDPVRLYASLLSSRGVLAPVILTQYRLPAVAGGDSTSGTYLDFYHLPGRDADDRLRRGIDHLKARVDVTIDRDAGLLSVKVKASQPALARALLKRLLVVLDSTTVVREQQRAARERAFFEERLNSARGELERAEDAVGAFLQQNRTYAGSPGLQTAFARLQRQVDFRQQVVTAMAQSFEQARLDAVRNTPSFAYVDDPDGPVRDASRPVRDAAVWLVVGAGAVLIGLLLADWLDLLRAAQPESYAVLQQFAGLFRRRRKE